MTRVRVRAVVAALSASALLAGCGSVPVAEGGFVGGDGSLTRVAPDERRPAPRITGELLGGGSFDSDSLAGSVVVYNVWGSWCAPCRKEAPALEAASRSTAGVAQFVGINTRDLDQAPALAFNRAFGMTYLSVFDPDGRELLKFGTRLPPSAIPSTIVVDREGRVAARVLGEATEATVRGLVEDVAAGKRAHWRSASGSPRRRAAPCCSPCWSLPQRASFRSSPPASCRSCQDTYATGLTAAEVTSGGSRGRLLLGTSLFVAGVALVFVSTGAIFGGLGNLLLGWSREISIAGGVLALALGLVFTGLLPVGQRTLRISRAPAAGLAVAPLLGVVIGVGWTPCIGPTLSIVMTLASTRAPPCVARSCPWRSPWGWGCPSSSPVSPSVVWPAASTGCGATMGCFRRSAGR